MSFNFQRCTGVDEDGQRCGFALANKHSTNTCIKHHLSHSLERTGKFDSMLIYISPLDPKDNRRWLGCLPTSGSSSFVLPHLTHTMPVPSKIGSLLKEAVVKKLAEDPSTSTSEISIGHALGFCPISVSLAAANKKTLENFVQSQRIDFSGDSSKLTISDFDKLIKEKIDLLESEKAEDKQMYRRVLELTSPYMRYYIVFPFSNIHMPCLFK